MMNRKVLKCFLLSFFLFLFSNLTLNAASFSINGNSSVYAGETIQVTISLNPSGVEIGGIQGDLEYSSNLEFVSRENIGASYNSSTKIFTFLADDEDKLFSTTKNLFKITFKATSTGQATIRLVNPIVSDRTGAGVSASGISKTITITNPPSSNTNLGSLSVSGTNISTGNLTANVGKDVSSITIQATAEDGGATVTGTGSKTLSYGKNTFTITVKAPSGATKDYTITVNREDPRSSNSNLSTLKVSGGDLNPKFNKNTTTYSMTVPFSVSSLDIKATAEDSKAKVSISGNTNLPAEATTDVSVTVTAENGSVKTYTIKVTREKDPNKPKSNNNYLTTITNNIGILSPAFDKEKTNYVIYLPYEIDRIELGVDVEDKEYGVLETSGPETLNVGTNRYEFKVTAEDGTSRSYIVNVVRGASVDGSSSNILLKDLEISNGSLDKKFKSDVNVYRYDKKKDFKLTPVPEDENTKVTVQEHDDIYTIILEASDGSTNIYTLVPKSSAATSNLPLIITIVASIPVVSGGTFLGYKVGMKKTLNKIKNFNSKEMEAPVKEEIVNQEDLEPKPKKTRKSKKTKETPEENDD